MELYFKSYLATMECVAIFPSAGIYAYIYISSAIIFRDFPHQIKQSFNSITGLFYTNFVLLIMEKTKMKIPS